MNPQQLTRYSKFMSLVLRHEPEKYGLQLDAHGWAQVDDLINAARRVGIPLTIELIDQIVAENNKQRFGYNEDKTAIRARQGHSISVDLQLEPLAPPALLFHGTTVKALESIRQQGLLRQKRQHVHLSLDETTARNVGQRHGKPVVLTISAGQMHAEGLLFYRSDNGVWLTDAVPVRFIQFPS